jgi:hypothetical protein
VLDQQDKCSSLRRWQRVLPSKAGLKTERKASSNITGARQRLGITLARSSSQGPLREVLNTPAYFKIVRLGYQSGSVTNCGRMLAEFEFVRFCFCVVCVGLDRLIYIQTNRRFLTITRTASTNPTTRPSHLRQGCNSALANETEARCARQHKNAQRCISVAQYRGASASVKDPSAGPKQ